MYSVCDIRDPPPGQFVVSEPELLQSVTLSGRLISFVPVDKYLIYVARSGTDIDVLGSQGAELTMLGALEVAGVTVGDSCRS